MILSGGENSLEKVYELFKKLKIHFLEGSFNLRKWRTNSDELRKLINSGSDKNVTPSKILGTLWNESRIHLYLNFKSCENCKNFKAG